MRCSLAAGWLGAAPAEFGCIQATGGRILLLADDLGEDQGQVGIPQTGALPVRAGWATSRAASMP